MKNTFYILLTLLLLSETACTPSSRSIETNIDLVAGDSICLPIDEHTYYKSQSIFPFEENEHEYLSFLDAEYSQKIHIYDLNNQELIKTSLFAGWANGFVQEYTNTRKIATLFSFDI